MNPLPPILQGAQARQKLRHFNKRVKLLTREYSLHYQPNTMSSFDDSDLVDVVVEAVAGDPSEAVDAPVSPTPEPMLQTVKQIVYSDMLSAIEHALVEMRTSLSKVQANQELLARAIDEQLAIRNTSLESRKLYEAYFENVRSQSQQQQQSGGKKGKGALSRAFSRQKNTHSSSSPTRSGGGSGIFGRRKGAKRGEQKIKCLLKDLVDEGAVTKTDFPIEAAIKSNTRIKITRNLQVPGKFDVEVKATKGSGAHSNLAPASIFLDELLDMQSRGVLEHGLKEAGLVVGVGKFLKLIESVFINPGGGATAAAAAGGASSRG